MIGQAIDALGEDGGSTDEGSISAFIRATHPGVPAAHDIFLRHYLAKHVAEGGFVCTDSGRYARCPDEAALVELSAGPSADGSSEAACVGSPVTEAKRGRGRPRKDGSSSPPSVGRKDCSVRAKSPALKCRRQSRQAAQLAADEDSVPPPPGAVDNKDGSQAASSTPRRRGRLRRPGQVTTTDGSAGALVAATKDGSEAPSTTVKEHGRPRELALVVVGDCSATAPIMDNICVEASPTTPVNSGHHPKPTQLVSATDMSAPAPLMDKKDGGEAPACDLAPVAKQGDASATSTKPDRSSQVCELALVAVDVGSVPVLFADKDDSKASPAACKRPRQLPCKAAPLATAVHASVPASTADKEAEGKALSASRPTGRRPPRKPAMVAAAGGRSAPTPIAGKKAGSKVSFAMPKLTPVTAGGSSTPVSVAGNEIPDDPSFVLLALPAPKLG